MVVAILGRSLRAFALRTRDNPRELYSHAMEALGKGEVAVARAIVARLKPLVTTAHDLSLAIEAEAWCLLCAGQPVAARDIAIRAQSSSPLLLSTLGVVVGTHEGAVDTLADALRSTPALDLVTHALVACNAAKQLAAVLERPGVVTRIPDVWLQTSSAIVFRSGAFEACEAICSSAFRAYGSPTHLFNAACCAARLGHVDRSLATLRRALEAGFSERARLFVDPDLEPVRADPRFAEL